MQGTSTSHKLLAMRSTQEGPTPVQQRPTGHSSGLRKSCAFALPLHSLGGGMQLHQRRYQGGNMKAIRIHEFGGAEQLRLEEDFQISALGLLANMHTVKGY